MKIERFEDIRAWQMAKDLAIAVYKTSETGPFAKDFALRDQIRRAAISVMSNVAEGFERSSDKEFQRFLFIAKGSAGEQRSQLFLATDLQYITVNEFENLKIQAEEVSKTLSAFITYLYGDRRL
ncbi:MAG: four helix bundle protein [Nitrospirales bacterium]